MYKNSLIRSRSWYSIVRRSNTVNNYTVTETCLISRYTMLACFIDIAVIVEVEIPTQIFKEFDFAEQSGIEAVVTLESIVTCQLV